MPPLPQPELHSARLCLREVRDDDVKGGDDGDQMPAQVP